MQHRQLSHEVQNSGSRRSRLPLEAQVSAWIHNGTLRSAAPGRSGSRPRPRRTAQPWAAGRVHAKAHGGVGGHSTMPRGVHRQVAAALVGHVARLSWAVQAGETARRLIVLPGSVLRAASVHFTGRAPGGRSRLYSPPMGRNGSGSPESFWAPRYSQGSGGAVPRLVPVVFTGDGSGETVDVGFKRRRQAPPRSGSGPR